MEKERREVLKKLWKVPVVMTLGTLSYGSFESNYDSDTDTDSDIENEENQVQKGCFGWPPSCPHR
jgi:hypothetical protein